MTVAFLFVLGLVALSGASSEAMLPDPCYYNNP